MPSKEHPVSHLLWCAFIAMRTAEVDFRHSTEYTRQRFLQQWLANARKNSAFPSVQSEIDALIALLKSQHHLPIDELLWRLWEQSLADCDLLQFRAVWQELNQHNWQSYLCSWPEEFIHELTVRRHRHNHVLLLSRPEESFCRSGRMLTPVTLQLIINRSKKDVMNSGHREELVICKLFQNANFQVVKGLESHISHRTRILTLYIGMASLSEEVWSGRLAQTRH